MNDARLDEKPLERVENLLSYFRQRISALARRAGSMLLVGESLDQTRARRFAWTYNPRQRRARQAPNSATATWARFRTVFAPTMHLACAMTQSIATTGP